MAKRGLYQRLRSNAQVRSALFCLGGLLMIVAVLIGPLPGPGFIILFPVGLMLVGRHFDESTIYRAAHAFEQAGDWKKM